MAGAVEPVPDTSYVKQYCEEQGEQCEVSRFEDAVHFLEGYRPGASVILMDIAMPDMNGLEAAAGKGQND